jgi:hypothetical protein
MPLLTCSSRGNPSDFAFSIRRGGGS